MKNKKNIFSEWINKIRNRNRPNEGIYYVSQRLRRTAKVVIPELTEINNNINNLTTNTAKKNESNTFTQNQKITGQLEIRKDADAIKIGNANENNACYVEFFNGNNRRGYVGHPRSSNNSFEINNGDNEIKLVGSAINVNSKRIVNVANPTANSDAVNKVYVDNRSSELTNEINSIKQKNTEQDNEINAIKQVNTTQTNEINSIKQKNIDQDNRISTLENKPSGGLTIYYDRILRLDTYNYNTESIVGDLTIRTVLYTIKSDKYIINMRGYGSTYFVVSFNLAYTNDVGDRYAICIARKTGSTLPQYIELNYDAVDYSRLTRQGEQ